MAKRRRTIGSVKDELYGVITSYKGYDISRLRSGQGDVYRVVDGLMPLSPDFETEGQAKKYIEDNL